MNPLPEILCAPAAVGVLVTALTAAVLTRRPRPAPRPAPPVPFDRWGRRYDGDDRFPPGAREAREAGARRSVRRAGNHVTARLVDACGPKKPWVVVVCDRSTGGLGLLCDKAFVEERPLAVRADNAPDGSPWVRVEVRHCRPAGKLWYVGCRFVETPPWSVLLLFG